MRVAYLLPPLHKADGWRSHARGFIGAIRKYVEPVLFVTAGDEEAAEQFFPGCQLFSLPAIQYPFMSRPQYARLVGSLVAVLRGHYPDVDMVHSLEAYPAGLVGHWLASRLKRPHLLTIHGTYGILASRSLPHRMLYRQVLRAASALCPVSPQTGEFVQLYFPQETARTNIRPILNGNDYYRSIPRQEAERRQPSQIPTLLSVGAVKPRKGYRLSLQAFAQLKPSFPDLRYWIVGKIDQSKYYQELHDFIASERLQGVELLGSVSLERLHECYRQASVFLLTPQQVGLHFDGFGLVYLEAGAFGLPVVGVRTGGVPSAICDGETGFVVDSDRVEEIVTALRLLLSDRELARRMGLANRDWAETLTWEKNAGEQYSVYQEIIKN